MERMPLARPGRLAPVLVGALLLVALVAPWPLPAGPHSLHDRATTPPFPAIPAAGAAQPPAQDRRMPVTTTRSVLVLLPQAGAPATLARLRATYRVSSLLEPRIAILEVNDGELARLGQEHDLSGVYPDTVPPEVLRHLRPEERLFVEAWLLQRATPKRVRPGEGLPWDAPGFQAPGPPSRGGP